MSILRRFFSRRTLAYASGGTVLATGTFYWYLNSGPAYPSSTKENRRPPTPWTPPSRAEMLNALRQPTSLSASKSERMDDDDAFDLLIVGGGATGAGVAVDAASRGLRVAVVERADFGSGTSSKSTKLVHGGVRYLQKAVLELDYEQYKLVREALHERRIFLHTAPYLSHMLPIMLPIYKYWQVPYYWAGCKLYDILAGKENMESSYLMSKGKALETFPMLKSEGLVGALVYYDGQHNDSRMNIALIMSAVKLGAVAANYCEVVDLLKNDAGKLTGARVRDNLTGAEWNVRARGVISATGPFTDTLLSLSSPSHQPVVQPSSGVHITLPNYYSPRRMGLLDPATSDGRVIFFLPWEGNTIAGTTDSPAPGWPNVQRDPGAGEEDIRWVLEEVRRYLSPDIRVRRGDVLSAWSGLRPLIRDPNAKATGTEGLVRSHIVYVDESGLLTIAGGKWTTYRAMAEEAIDRAVKEFGLERRVKSGCVTKDLRLVGSDGWSRNMFIPLIQTYGLSTDVAQHLSSNYGDRAWTVCSLVEPTGETWPVHGKRIAPAYPFIEAEVHYAIHHEYAQTPIDVLARRTRLAFLNARAALAALPRVVDIMGDELGWGREERKKHVRETVRFLVESMGLDPGYVESADGQKKGGKSYNAKWIERQLKPTGMLDRVERGWWWIHDKANYCGRALGLGWIRDMKEKNAKERALGRSRFEVGEVATLQNAFSNKAATFTADSKNAEKHPKVRKSEVFETLKAIPGFGGVSEKEFEYVLEEAGFRTKEELDWEEFLEICGGLKEVTVAPAKVTATKRERLIIPVEKSGGGV